MHRIFDQFLNMPELSIKDEAMIGMRFSRLFNHVRTFSSSDEIGVMT